MDSDELGTNRRLRVGVIFGGRSSEHAISCVSAGSVLSALDPARYDVMPIGITTDGRWVRMVDDRQSLRIEDGELPAVDPSGSEVVLRSGGRSAVLSDLTAPDGVLDVDVVFPVMHGPWGEDGTVQGLLELVGVPYVGSGVFASAAGMDKGFMKMLAVAAGIPTGAFEVVTDRQWVTDREGSIARCLRLQGSPGAPLFVKPARAGSSVGITLVRDAADLQGAIETARGHDLKVIVEQGIENAREIECGVLVVDGDARASVCAEVAVSGDHEFYDFEAKYLDNAAELTVPAALSAGVQERVQELALAAFEAIGCEGLARVDFFVRPDGSVLLNEVNTMPGFTSISLFPRMWAASGIDYPTLVDTLIADALRRGTGLR